MSPLWFILTYFYLCYSPSTEAHRIKRFLNSEVHNRINVLEQAHTAHREDTSSARIIFFGVIGSVSVIIVVVFIIVIVLCHRLRRILHERQTPALGALQSSGLSSIHPMANVLFNTLQQLHTMERNNHTQPSSTFSYSPSVPTNLNINPLLSNALKF